MPGIDLYESKKPLFELCEFLIRKRVSEIGISNPFPLELETFHTVMAAVYADTELERWLVLKKMLVHLTTNADPVYPSRPLLEITGLEEAFRPGNDGLPDPHNQLTLKYRSESMRRHHEELQAFTMQNAQRPEDGTTHCIKQSTRITLQFRYKSINIRGVDSIQARVVRLLLGETLPDADDQPSISIRRFSQENEDRGTTLDPEYVPGKWINEEALIEMALVDFKDAAPSQIAALKKSFRSAIQGVNQKSSSGVVIQVKENPDERLVRICTR